MKLEKPCSPGCCLGMLNANMRMDILRPVHEDMFARKDERDKGMHKKSPLIMLIESIEDVLTRYAGGSLVAAIGRHPFYAGPGRVPGHCGEIFQTPREPP